MKIIYRGVDNLDFTIKGKVKTNFLMILEKYKKMAQKEHKNIEFNHDGIVGVVLPNGASGGYQYILHTETYALTIKDNIKDDYPVRCSIRSILLATNGFAGARKIVLSAIEKIMTYTDIIPSRIDVCVDFQKKGFEIRPELFLTNGRSKKGVVGDLNSFALWGGKKIETMTIGKMPNRQLQIYNKSKQVKSRPKADFWRYIWDDNPNYDPNASDVFRLELRWGREFFRRNNIMDFDDLEQQIESFIKITMGRVFMVDKVYKNVSRDSQKTSLWLSLKQELIEYSKNMINEVKLDVDIPARIQGMLDNSFKTIRRRIFTNITSVLAMQGKDFNINEIEKIFNEVKQDLNQEYNFKHYQQNYDNKKQEYGRRFFGLVYDKTA